MGKLLGHISSAAACAAAALALSLSAAAMPLLPKPAECRFTGGTCRNAAVKTVLDKSIPPQGYALSVTPDGITIKSSDAAGEFYARQTLRQLETKDAKGKNVSYPNCEIKDAPAFKWRGMMLDEARHFFGKEAVCGILERMAQYKLNVFHWHLTDDQGWRIDIPELPELARKGSWREGRCESETPLFYTEKDIKEILDFAKARHITVVPEIDFPGHFGAALRAYPHLACGTGRKNILCLGNPEAVRLAEKVLDRVCELFPGEVVHIGGDECPVANWAKCPKCKALMERERIGDLKGLQPWLTRRLAAHLKKKGKRMSGWEEIAVGLGKLDKWGESENLASLPDEYLPPKSSLVMGYHARPAALAANIGFDVVSCPTWHCYFDYQQKLPEDPHRYHRPDIRWCPIESVYGFDPFEGVKPEARGRIAGVECCSWTEKTRNITELEWKIWPRTLAFAEVAWLDEEPQKRDFKEFCERAAAHRRRLVAEHVNCAPVGR